MPEKWLGYDAFFGSGFTLQRSMGVDILFISFVLG
jgi:hypothetical protein